MTHTKVTEIQQALADALDLIDNLPADVRSEMTVEALISLRRVGGEIENSIAELSEDQFIAQAPRLHSL